MPDIELLYCKDNSDGQGGQLLIFCHTFAGNETCPQPQTSEHLAAVAPWLQSLGKLCHRWRGFLLGNLVGCQEIMRLKHIIILQNKVSSDVYMDVVDTRVKPQ